MPTHTSDAPNIVMDREALIDALERRLPWAKKSDKERLAAHRKHEQEVLVNFRARLKEALAWDYTKASKEYFRVDTDRDRTSCPTSRADRIEAHLTALRLSQQKQFTIAPSSDIHMLLTHDDAVPASMC